MNKRKQNHLNEIFKICTKKTKAASQVKLFVVEKDNKLNFEQNINPICKSAANQSSYQIENVLRFSRRKSPNKYICSIKLQLLYSCMDV